ncbi:MAG TPA: hypothetical protein VEO00_07750 [Actinomycetota bacterium]|nr:hypothetical protein [Actinomycetota bacterium]
MTNPVKQFRIDEKARQGMAVQAAQTELGQIDGDLATSRDTVAVNTRDLAAQQAEESRLRQAIAAAAMPADADALVDQLEDNLKQQSVSSAALNDAIDQAATLERSRLRVAAELDAARATQAQAGADLAIASADDEVAERWRTAATGTAVGNAVAAAGSASTTALRTAARTRLQSLAGGSTLLDLFKRRFEEARADSDERRAKVVRAQGALDTVATKQDPVNGPVVVAGAGYAAAREVVRAIAETTVQRLDAALLALQTASALGNLTTDEQTRIDDRATHATAVTGTTSSVSAASDVLDARKDVRVAEVAFDVAALAKEATDSTFDRDTDASVKTKRDAWNAAKAALSAAEGKVTPTRQQQLDDWEVAIPVGVSSAVVGFLRASAEVDAIKGLDPQGRVNDLNAAETTYAGALQDRTDAAELRMARALEVAVRLEAEAAVEPVADVREAAKVRGDR